MPRLLQMLFAPKSLTPGDDASASAPASSPAPAAGAQPQAQASPDGSGSGSGSGAQPPNQAITRVELVPKRDGWVKLVGDEARIRAGIARRNRRLADALLPCRQRDGLYAPRGAYMREVAEQERRRSGLGGAGAEAGAGAGAEARGRKRGRSDDEGDEEGDVPSDVDDPSAGPGALRRGVWAMVGEVRLLREAVAALAERAVRPSLTTHDDLRAFVATEQQSSPSPSPSQPPSPPSSVPRRAHPVLPWRASDGASVVSVTLPRPDDAYSTSGGD